MEAVEDTIRSAEPQELAVYIVECLQRLGQHGREGAEAVIAQAQTIEDEATLIEGLGWIANEVAEQLGLR